MIARSRPLLIVLAALSLAPAVRAQEAAAPTEPSAPIGQTLETSRALAAGYLFRVTMDRPDRTYRVGETATFTCTLTDTAGKPVDAVVNATVGPDGAAPKPTTFRPLETGGTFTMTGTMAEPGFLQFEASFTPAGAPRKLLARAGAAFDREKIGPSAEMPADFDAFWADQRAKLAAVPMNLKLTPVKSKDASVEAFDVQADIGDGRVMSGYLARPVGAQARSLPAMVLTHGAGVASSRLDLCIEFAKAGILTLDFNAHGLPNGQPAAFYAGLRTGELLNYSTRGKESRETIYFRTIFLRLFRAIDVLTAQPEWDGRRVIANGRSQGGGQSLAAGGLDPRVTCTIAEIPGLCDLTGLLVGRSTGWPHYFGIVPRGAPDPTVLEAIKYYDAVNFARLNKGPTYVTVGWTDHLVPPTTVYAMFNQLAGPKKMLDLPPHGHVQAPEAAAFVRASIKEYLAQSEGAAR